MEEIEMKKRVISMMLATAMALSVCACGNEEKVTTSESKTQVTSSETAVATETSVEETGITFPLKDEVSFDFMIKSDTDVAAMLEKSAWWQELYEATNVKINWITVPTTNTMTSVNAMFSSGQEGDAIYGPLLSDTDLLTLADNKLLIALDEYVDDAELMPNLNERVFAESAGTRGLITCSDGHVYGLPKYYALEGNYIENPLWINKAWVEKAGWKVEDIKTIDDLEKVLTYFAENDMNGNGDTKDEIPYIIWSNHGYAHVESFLGLYGIATKSGNYDSFVYVEDGAVKFAPTAEGYKDAIKKLKDWYDKDLIWSEAFVATKDTFNAKLAAELPLVGMITAKTAPTTNADDYVRIEPVSVDGYEASWYLHPGLLGTKGRFSVTKSCENVDVLMAWIDLFYDFDATVNNMYGYKEAARYDIVDGKVVARTIAAAEKDELIKTLPIVNDSTNQYPSAITAADFASRISMSAADIINQESYDMYEKYITDEIWPRPYIAVDDSTRIAELRTDIFNTVGEKKAAWVTGVSDIDAEWDAYVKSLEKMGLAEFIEIYQRSYDAFNEAQK